MKQLFNYSTVPGYEEAIRRTGKSLEDYLTMLGLDGIELLVYRSEPYMRPFDNVAVGAHLRSWSCWYDLWKNNKDRLYQIFRSDDALRDYYGGTQKRAWLLQIKRNIQAALIEKPEYLVYRVEEVSPAEQYSWNFDHTNAEVMKMAARVFNRVSDQVPADTKVLFENSWWPGLTLQNAKQTGEFLEKIKFDNIGLMLDTGHLLNTNPDLKSEREGIDYICQTLKNLGELRHYIKGVHLSCSLSGEYQRQSPRMIPSLENDARLLSHVCSIDQHKPFTDPAVTKIFELIEPDYVVHVLYYDDFNQLARQITEQKQLLKA